MLADNGDWQHKTEDIHKFISISTGMTFFLCNEKAVYLPQLGIA